MRGWTGAESNSVSLARLPHRAAPHPGPVATPPYPCSTPIRVKLMGGLVWAGAIGCGGLWSLAVLPHSSPTPDTSASTQSPRCQPIRLLRVRGIITSILIYRALKDPAPEKAANLAIRLSCIHTAECTQIHTHPHPRLHAFTHIGAATQTCTHACTWTHMHTRTHKCTSTQYPAHKNTRLVGRVWCRNQTYILC